MQNEVDQVNESTEKKKGRGRKRKAEYNQVSIMLFLKEVNAEFSGTSHFIIVRGALLSKW